MTATTIIRALCPAESARAVSGGHPVTGEPALRRSMEIAAGSVEGWTPARADCDCGRAA